MSLTAVDLLVRAVALMVAAWVTVTALRRQSASLRAGVWTLALGGLLVLPILTSITPSVRVGVWPALDAAPRPAAGPEVAVSEVSPAERVVTRGAVRSAPVTAVSSSATPRRGDVRRERFVESLAPVEVSGRPIWVNTVLLVWGLVAAVLCVRVARSHVSLARLARQSAANTLNRNAVWRELVDDTRVRLGIARPVAVCVAESICVPAVTGLWRPVLLLPAEADEWTPDVRRAVMLHELAHVARWDALGQLVSQLACAVYWCVPLVWHGARRAAALREQASDDVVLRAGVPASVYAQTLLEMSSVSGFPAEHSAALAMANPLRIRDRIVAILDPAPPRRRVHSGVVATVLFGTVGMIGVVAAVEPTARVAEPAVMNAVAGSDGPLSVATEAASTNLTRLVLSVPLDSGQTAPSRPCDGNMNQSSSSSNSDGSRRTWTVKLSGRDCKVDLRAEGIIEFNTGFTDINSLSSGGSFTLDVTEGGVRRELELRQQGGTLDRVWRVDGKERAYDTEARTWFAGILITLDRRTAIGVDHRLPVLLKQGGVDAVLRETAMMPSDFAQGRYYTKLLEATRLTAAELRRLMDQAASMTESDHYANQLVTAITKQGVDDPGVRASTFELIGTMESDHYQASAIKTVVGAGRPTTADLDFLVGVMPQLESDHYMLDVLTTILRGPLEPRHRTVLARVAKNLESDHYATEFLKALVNGELEPAGREALFDVVATIESDHYVVEVLKNLIRDSSMSRDQALGVLDVLNDIQSDHYRNEAIAVLLTVRALTEQDLLNVVRSVRTMRGDHDQSEALQRIAGHGAATDRVRREILDVADTLSRHYRDQVRRAAGGSLPLSAPFV